MGSPAKSPVTPLILYDFLKQSKTPEYGIFPLGSSFIFCNFTLMLSNGNDIIEVKIPDTAEAKYTS